MKHGRTATQGGQHHTTRSDKRRAFRRGAAMAVPIMLGYFPLATAYGILAYQAGLPAASTVAMSLLVYAGASQFMAVNMIGLGAAGLEIVLACFMVNIRHIVMSMSLLQRYGHLPTSTKRAASLGITDETFAMLSFAPADSDHAGGWFLAGVMATSYASWVLGSLVGSLLSSLIPGDWAASMAMALYAMFIGLLVPGLQRKPDATGTAVAGALVCTALNPVVGAGWAIAMGTLLGGLVGVLRGHWDPDIGEASS